jgi:hypothetical protein
VTYYVLALGLEKLLLFLKLFDASQVLSYRTLSGLNYNKGSSFLVLKTVCLKLEGLLLANRNALNVAFHLAKDTFRTTTRIFLVRNNALKVAFLIPKTQEHFKTSMLDLRCKHLTLFALLG